MENLEIKLKDFRRGLKKRIISSIIYGTIIGTIITGGLICYQMKAHHQNFYEAAECLADKAHSLNPFTYLFGR